MDGRVGRQDGSEEVGFEALEVEARALRLAAVVEGDDDAVTGAQLALELRLGLADRARRGRGRLGADRDPLVVR